MSYRDLHTISDISDILRKIIEDELREKFGRRGQINYTPNYVQGLSENIVFTESTLKTATSPRYSWVINYGHDGTNTNATFAAAKFNNGAVFNGTTADITITHTSNLLQTGEITICLWVKTTATTKPIVNKKTSSTTGWAIEIDGSGKATGRFMGTTLTSTTSVNDNAFNFIELKRDGSNLATLAINNVQEASATISGDISTTANIIMGKDGVTFTSMTADEFQVFDRAISANERDMIYDSNVPFAKGSRVYLRFDESSGNAIDSSGLKIGHTDVNA